MSLGGDFDQKPIHSYCKYVSPQAITADTRAIDVYTSGGGSLFCYYYSQWPDRDIDRAPSCPLVKAVIERNRSFAQGGQLRNAAAGQFDPRRQHDRVRQQFRGQALRARGLDQLECHRAGDANLPLHDAVAAAGGSHVLVVDDASTASSATAGADATGTSNATLTLKLTKGQHTVKIRNTGPQAIGVMNIAVVMPNGPAAPGLLSARFADGSCGLTWSPSPEASAYKLYYGTTSGNYTSSMAVGNVCTASIPGLDNSAVCYAAVQAVNASGLLSPTSNEIRAAQHSTAPQTLVDFKDQESGRRDHDARHYVAGLQVHCLRKRPLALHGRAGAEVGEQVSDPRSPYAHLGMRPPHRAGGFPALRSLLPRSCSIYGGASVIITGYDPSGAAFRRIVNLPDRKDAFVVPVTLDWARVCKVETALERKAGRRRLAGAGGRGRQRAVP